MNASSALRNTRRILAGLILGAVLLTGAAGFGLMLMGSKYFVVQTPSMATYAPVGTFVISQPTRLADIKPGTMLLFHPPASTETYFHRVVNVGPQGVQTKGDLNRNVDPWLLQAKDIQGRELAHFVGLGWLAKALPLLLVGGLTLWLAVHFLVDVKWRFPAYVSGGALIIAATNAIIKPWFRDVVLSQTVRDHHLYIQLVSTGILPVDVHVSGAAPKVAHSGVITSLVGAEPDGQKHFVLQILPHFDGWTLAVFLVIVSLPLVASLCYLVYARHMGWDLLTEDAVQPPATATYIDQAIDNLLAEAERERHMKAATDGWSVGHINAMWHNRLPVPHTTV